MRLVLIESPFAGDRARNRAYLRDAIRDCLRRNEAPFASHAMYPVPFVEPEKAVRVALTRGLFATVSASDLERVSAFKWLAIGKRGEEYAARNVRVDGKQSTIYMHRFITSAQEGQEVDHENGDRLDNSRENLRVCSHASNLKNQKRQRNSASGFKGVCRRGDKWSAQLVFEGKQRYLGAFASPEEAARAYDAEAVAKFGAFARTNFPVGAPLDDDVPEDRAWGIEAGLAWGSKADATVVYADLGVSSGMQKGIERARAEGRPVETRFLPGWER